MMNRILVTTILTTAGSALAVGACSSAPSEPSESARAPLTQTGTFVGLAGKCLDASGDGSADGTKVQLWDCNGTNAQEWTLDNGQITGPGGKCLDVTGDVSNNGTPVELWDCWGGPNQQWTLQANGEVVGIGGKCLDVTNADSNDGTQIQIWDCGGGANQLWTFSGGSTGSSSCGGSGSGGGSGGSGGGTTSGGTSSGGTSSGGTSSGGSTSGGSSGGGSGAPPQAAAVGYTLNTFSSTFAQNLVDTGNTQKSGYQWYLGQFFGSPATSPSSLTFNADGTLTVDGGGINSASPSPGGWVGQAFGGGAYFEAEFSFNPQDVISANGSAWPAWWAMAIEHLALLPDEQWPGQPSGYAHFIETDFFEYDVWSFSPHNEYGGATHDWYGVYNQTCGNVGYCNVSNAGGGGTNFSDFQVQTPASTDYTQYHAFGYLWVPATATTQGYAQYYFDGQPTNDKITWSQYTGSESPPPGTAPWTFGILDQQHVALIIGTGNSQPMRLKAVHVWQASTAGNLVQ